MGLNHIAVIVNYAILDLIDFNNIPPQSIRVHKNKQKKQYSFRFCFFRFRLPLFEIFTSL